MYANLFPPALGLVIAIGFFIYAMVKGGWIRAWYLTILVCIALTGGIVLLLALANPNEVK